MQFARQFEVPSKPPSSQISPGFTIPSPHIPQQVETNVDVQVHPGSTKHYSEHPSKFAVLLSSHYSPEVIKVSAQVSQQVSALSIVPPEQVHPLINPVQSARQPSPSF